MGWSVGCINMSSRIAVLEEKVKIWKASRANWVARIKDIMLKQRTIAKECSLTGKGIHTGHSVNVVFKPRSANEASVLCVRILPNVP